MESLPESSNPDSKTLSGEQSHNEISLSNQNLGDYSLVHQPQDLPLQRSPQSVNKSINQLAKQSTDQPQPVNQQINQRDRLTWADISVVLSIPVVGGLLALGLIYIYNPFAISWLAPTDTPVFQSSSLWNLPKSPSQIEAELKQSLLKLGEKYTLKTGEILYTVLEVETQNIREIRLYQPIRDRGIDKLLLVSTTTIAGIDEYFVRSPSFKYATTAIPERLKPNRNRLPLKKLNLLEYADSESKYGGIWFSTSATIDGIGYGQIYYFAMDKRSRLYELEAWTSPAGELPQWRRVLSNVGNTDRGMQLVINQAQEYEPAFLIYQPENRSSDSIQNIYLRQINLNEAKNQPKLYQEALVLASGGLWSPALAKFKQLIEDLKAQNQSLSPFLQEQYDLIALHAKITAERAQDSNFSRGEQALLKVIDGQWEAALAIASDPSYSGDLITEILNQYHPHIWQRVTTMLTFTGVKKEVKLWGGLVILQRQGLRQAENWLRSQKVSLQDSDQLLQRLDLAPLTLNPQQLLGTVSYLGKNAGSDWLIPPPPLDPEQAWYEVNINLLKDGNKWRNEPFSELSDRATNLIWRTLGLASNNNLGVVLYDNFGKSQTTTLTAQSIWVSGGGTLKILASGSTSLRPLINQSTIPPLITSGGLFDPPDGAPVEWQSLSPRVIERLIRAMYNELQRNGQVSVDIEEFSVVAQQEWKLSAVDLDGYGQPEYLLLLNRDQIDLGDRHYPLAIAFSSDGSLLFSDMNGGRVWIDLLPSETKGQILLLRNGRYEAWNLR